MSAAIIMYLMVSFGSIGPLWRYGAKFRLGRTARGIVTAICALTWPIGYGAYATSIVLSYGEPPK